MKKLLSLLIVLLSICFIGKVNAEYVNYEEQEDVFKVKKGDLVCNLNYYFYGLFAYNYDDEEVKYVGSYDADYMEIDDMDGDGYTEMDTCILIDPELFYGADELGVPDTDEYLIYKEDNYAGKASIVPYFTPEVSISCDKEVIEYGETAECVLGVVKEKVNYELTFKEPTQYYDEEHNFHDGNYDSLLDTYKPSLIQEATFNFTNDNFKIVDYSSEYEVAVLGAQYELKLNENGQDAGSYELLRFTITPVSEDEEGTGYVIAADDFTLMSNLGSVTFSPTATIGIRKAEKKENPNTMSTNIYVIVLVACVSLVLLVLAIKKTTFEKIS